VSPYGLLYMGYIIGSFISIALENECTVKKSQII
jgi:hypothetical protein